MSSASTRIEIVQRAVKQAGRSAELHAHAKELLNDLLRYCAITKRYKTLRKVGSSLTLSSGSSTAPLPSDFGSATENLLFGTEKLSLTEFEMDDFIERGGFPQDSTTNSRPSFYMTDTEAGVWRFNTSADQAYSFIPVYYKLPANLSVDQSADQEKIWYENDEAIIEGLIWKIYGYTDDAREFTQEQRWERLDAEYRRGTLPIQGGAARLRLSSATFRPRRNVRTGWFW